MKKKITAQICRAEKIIFGMPKFLQYLNPTRLLLQG